MLRLSHIIFISSLFLSSQQTIGQTIDTVEIFLQRIDTVFYNGRNVDGGFLWKYQQQYDSLYIELSEEIGTEDMGLIIANGTYQFKPDAPDGVYLIYSNTQLIQTASIINGKKNGVWINYYSNPIMDESTTQMYFYIDDKLNLAKYINTKGTETDSLIYYFSIYPHADSMIGYWSNGTVKNKFYYNENQHPSGIWKYWDKNGRLIKEEFYDNGKFIERKEY